MKGYGEFRASFRDRWYGKRRVDALAWMFAHISKKSYLKSRELILRTATGKSIFSGYPCLLYEQEGANLCEIVDELREMDIPDLDLSVFTVESIVSASDAIFWDNIL